MEQETKRIRAFIAVDPETGLVEKITQVQAELAKTRADVRWVRPDGMHVTLKFLGTVDEGMLAPLERQVFQVGSRFTPWDVEFRGLGAFPSLRRARVLWVGVRDDGKLAALAGELARALTTLGFPVEERPFQPHLTLGRVRSLHRCEALEEAAMQYVDEPFGHSRVSEIVLYRSDLQPGGAVYTRLWTTLLGEKKGDNT